jgi:integrase
MMADLEHQAHYGEARHTWRDAVVEWAAQAAVKPSTRKRYLVSLGRVDPILGELYVDDVTAKTIARIGRRPGVSNATRRRDITAVSVVLRWCAGQGWREDNPARTWDRGVIIERRDPIVLPAERDIDAVVAAAPGNFAALIRFAQYTGMRQEEVAALRHADIDRRRAVAMLGNTKTGRPRAVPLDERAIGTIPGTVKLGSPWVFWHGEDGDRYLNVASRFAAIARRAETVHKIRRFRFHDLRHWFSVDYLRRGGGIYTLQKILGHSSIRTTEIYLDYLAPAEAEAAKKGAG